jgi:hypothetical protein
MEGSCEFGNQPSGPSILLGNYRMAQELVASQIVLSSMELVRIFSLFIPEMVVCFMCYVVRIIPIYFTRIL